MEIANGLALPNPLSNGTTASAVDVMADYNYLLGALNRALLDSGGGAGMNAQSTQIHNLANGVAANDAVNLSQLGGYALLAGATFTGSVGFTQPISATSITAASLALTGAASAASNLATGQISPYLVGFSHSRNGQVGYHLYNNGGVVEWVAYQPAHATDDSFHVATGIGGTLTDRLTITPAGLVTLNGGISSSGALALTGPLSTAGAAANCVGYLGTPQTIHTANYPFALTDIGTDQAFNGVGLTATIPANASVAFPIGAIIVGTNLNASPLTIAITSDTLLWSGTTTTGSRTIGQNGEYRLRKITATSWLITGTAMS